MDFARKQMEKMGWKEGKGLGKNEQGVNKPIRLQSQMDSVGLGFDRTSQFNTNIWFAKIDVAIQAAKKKAKRKRTEEEAGESSPDIPKRKSKKRRKIHVKEDTDSEAVIQSSSSFYNQFEKTECLSAGLVERVIMETESDIESQESVEDLHTQSKRKSFMDIDKVFKKTKGVTCHRSAHVGLSLSGKMKRLQEQEKEFSQGLKVTTTPQLQKKAPLEDIK